ncbi:MAG: cyclic nucleotide-binding domain-containing protein [Chloroflexota bacterium]|nr:MAG: cyclic nucleotide-binding domain-containing protein [Chloroflexota bacterium]
MKGAQILELVEIFADLTPGQLEQIYKICKEENYHHDEIIFEENSPSTDIYVIIEGEVEILVNTSPNQDHFEYNIPQRIALLEKGQSFGEIALVDQGLRSATARCASEDCRLMLINRKDFMKLLQENHDIGFIVMSNLSADLCMKIRKTTFMIRETLMYRSSRSS